MLLESRMSYCFPDAFAEPAAPDARDWVAAITAAYSPDIVWSAPGRGIALEGRLQVIACLNREAEAMQSARITPLRRSQGDQQVIEESVIRFAYAGSGIEGVSFPAGTIVELERLRILTLEGGQVAREVSVERWTAL